MIVHGQWFNEVISSCLSVFVLCIANVSIDKYIDKFPKQNKNWIKLTSKINFIKIGSHALWLSYTSFYLS